MTSPRPERHHTATAYVVDGDRTLLLWHTKLGMWLPPGGHSEPNEDPVETALREATEESGLAVAVIPPADLPQCSGPTVLPPPAVILIEDIVRSDQPRHQHIDHVYFTRALEPVDWSAPVPHGAHRWVRAGELAGAFSLPAPDGTLVAVAEDVRLLGVRAIAAALGESRAC
ncbi:MAG: NUDIX domain-containing protein [Dehalococcoidia bacterium]|nr:NUDIX domain-containing protein [Dehalococcoidia bacterium]